jgi:hypothetical protein
MCRGGWRSAGPLHARTSEGSAGICDPHDIAGPIDMTWTSCIIVQREQGGLAAFMRGWGIVLSQPHGNTSLKESRSILNTSAKGHGAGCSGVYLL